MTLQQIIDRTLQSCGLADSGTTYNNDVIYALEQVQDEIISRINFTSLMKLSTSDVQMTASTQSYALPVDFWKMVTIWESLDYDRELIRITPNEYKTYLGDVDSDTETEPHYYDLLDYSSTQKKIYFFDYLGSGGTSFYIPFVYVRKLSYISVLTQEHILMYYYPYLFIAGASYFMYRDRIYRDQPEKIAFRRQEFDRQIQLVEKVERAPNKITTILPKRVLPATYRKLRTQSSGYSS